MVLHEFIRFGMYCFVPGGRPPQLVGLVDGRTDGWTQTGERMVGQTDGRMRGQSKIRGLTLHTKQIVVGGSMRGTDNMWGTETNKSLNKLLKILREGTHDWKKGHPKFF